MFLAIQLVSFAFWQGIQSWDKSQVTSNVANSASHEVAETYDYVRFVARNKAKDLAYLTGDTKNQITSVFKQLPTGHTSTLKNIVLDYDSSAYRGLGGKSIIILRAVDIDPSEFIAVLIHEIGHVVDLGHLSEPNQLEKSEFTDNGKPIYKGDVSLDFYRISWEDDKIRKSNAGNLDFVSGYALTDPFEDFAESYVYYILHNKDFKSKSKTNDTLLKKYQFMKNKVFNGEEFDTGKKLSEGLNDRPWDITLIGYDLEVFLGS